MLCELYVMLCQLYIEKPPFCDVIQKQTDHVKTWKHLACNVHVYTCTQSVIRIDDQQSKCDETIMYCD